MFKTLLLFLSIFVGLLPSSGFKTSLEHRFETQLSSNFRGNTTNSKSFEPITKVPERAIDFETISIGANAAYFEDFDSSEILYSKNATKKLPIASITKLMTAIVAVKEIKPDEIITVPVLRTRPLDAVMGLRPGTKIKFNQLLAGLLIESGSDAAYTISNHIAKGESGFAAMMNAEASLLGLTDTQFTNSVGYDDANNFSSARDITKLARVALTNPQISTLVSKKTYTARDETGRGYFLTNTNKLLTDSKYIGIKTGTTFEAGECLASLYKDGKREIIGAVLKSPDRFFETRKIIEWTKTNFSW